MFSINITVRLSLRMLKLKRQICKMANVDSATSFSTNRSSKVRCKSNDAVKVVSDTILSQIDYCINQNVCWTDEEKDRLRERFIEVCYCEK